MAHTNRFRLSFEPRRPRRFLHAALSGLLVLAIVVAAPAQAPAPAPAFGKADAKRYLDNVKELSAPAMEGRGAGTAGIALAAKLLEERYRSHKRMCTAPLMAPVIIFIIQSGEPQMYLIEEFFSPTMRTV
jgi:hypothetical protein